MSSNLDHSKQNGDCQRSLKPWTVVEQIIEELVNLQVNYKSAVHSMLCALDDDPLLVERCGELC